MTSTEHTESVAREIAGLHKALALWLSGRCPRDGQFFQREFRDRFHDDFYNVQPAGRVASRAGLLDALDNGYGRSPEFDIRIRNVVARQNMGNGAYVLATCEEYQTGAKNSARANNARLSTVLFESVAEGRLIWRAIHETWLPDNNHAAENFQF